MASRYMKIKRIILPMITVVLMTSQLTGCALFSQKEVEDTLRENEEVVLEIQDKAPQDSTSIGNVDISNIDLGDDTTSEDTADDSDIGVIEEDYTPYYKEIYEFGQSIGEGLADGACYEIEKGTAQDYVVDGRIPSIDAYSAWRLAEHPLPANQTEFNRDESVFIDPTELDPNAFQETSGQPEDQQPVENGQPSKVENSGSSNTGSSNGSAGSTTKPSTGNISSGSTQQPVEQPSTGNNTSSAEGIVNGMITAGGLNRPAPSFTPEELEEAIRNGTAGTISDEALEEVSKGWKTN